MLFKCFPHRSWVFIYLSISAGFRSDGSGNLATYGGWISGFKLHLYNNSGGCSISSFQVFSARFGGLSWGGGNSDFGHPPDKEREEQDEDQVKCVMSSVCNYYNYYQKCPSLNCN